MGNLKRVMLIDDDEDDCFFFETDMPDLLFLDWNMPKRTGKECLSALRNTPAFSSMPIVIYTTSRALADRLEADHLGASYFLSKPQTIRDLTEKLQQLFSMDWKSSKVALP